MTFPRLSAVSSSLAALTAHALLFATFVGCGDSSSSGESCAGGVVVDGKCEGKCEDSLCLDGNICVGNRCMLECTSHTQCFSPLSGDPILQECVSQPRDTEAGLNDGANVYVCTESTKNEAYGRLCPFGIECDNAGWVCPNGTPCEEGTDSEGCSAAECRPMTCNTTGEGDAEAYCTSWDCTADADCGPGMYCGIVNLPNNICGTSKGDEEPCVDPGSFTTDGATFQEGPISLLRNKCLKREPCAPCESKTDCSISDLDMECVVIGETKGCAPTCASTEDCADDATCYEGYCLPKTGSCKPPTSGDVFCHKCLNDLECGGTASNTIACVEAGAGIKGCFDVSLPDACTVDADCPESPGGLHGECLDAGEGVEANNPAYHRCYLPFLPGPSSFQCWKEND